MAKRTRPRAGVLSGCRGKTFIIRVERSKRLALPSGLFLVFEEAPRTVQRDGYIELQREMAVGEYWANPRPIGTNWCGIVFNRPRLLTNPPTVTRLAASLEVQVVAPEAQPEWLQR